MRQELGTYGCAMLDNFIFRGNPLLFPSVLFVALALAVALPTRYGARFIGDLHVRDELWNPIFAGLLALVAFLLGLSYAQAQGRFDARRELVVNEANAIGSTWLLADQLPRPQSARFRTILKRYSETRLRAYEKPADLARFNREVKDSEGEQDALWGIVSPAVRAHANHLGLSLLLQALNDTISFSDAQDAALTQHIPTAVVVLTVFLVLLGGLATGFSFARMKARPAVFALLYVVALTLVVEMFVDLDRPQTGFVTVNLDPLRHEIGQMR